MNKTLVCAACAAALLLTSSANAQEMDHVMMGEAGVTAAGGVQMTVTQVDAGQMNGEVPTLYTEGRPVQIQGQAQFRPMPPMPMDGKRPIQMIQVVNGARELPPNPPRKTNKEIIEHVRELKEQAKMMEQNGEFFEQRVETMGGTTSGQMRVMRMENGQIKEDRTLQAPTGTPGMPMRLRASTTFEAGKPGMLTRMLMASGSRAMFLRNFASSTDLPWMNQNGSDFTVAGSVISSTTAEGNVIFRFEQKKPQMRTFMNQVFNLFKKTTGEAPVVQFSNLSF